MSNAAYFLGGLGLGAVAGSLITYYAARKRLEAFYTEIATEQIEAERVYWTDRVDTLKGQVDDLSKDRDEHLRRDPSDMVLNADDYVEILTELGYAGDPSDVLLLFERQVPVHDAVKELFGKMGPETEEPEAEEPEEEEQTFRVFDPQADLSNTDDEDLEEYLEYSSERDESQPHIIHVSDFMARNIDDYEKIPLIYYEDDDVLTDERKRPVVDANRFLGHEWSTEFGRFSNDRNLLYIRNPRPDIMTDFEVRKVEASFASSVLGVKEKPRGTKMREDDE